jgi:O-antigen/teichoic acid export membrane protein
MVSGTSAAPASTTSASGPLARRFAGGVAWNFVATVSMQGSTFLANLLLANLLGAPAFGRYALTLGTLQAIGGVAGLGLGTAATRFVAEWRTSDRERAGRFIGLCRAIAWIAALVAAGLLLVSADALSGRVLQTVEVAPMLRVGAIPAIAIVLSSVHAGALAGLEQYAALGRAALASGVAYVGGVVLGGWAGGANGAVIGLAASGVVQVLLLDAALRRAMRTLQLPVVRAEVGRERDILLHWVLPNLIGGLTSVPALWALQAILANRVGTTVVGFYTAAVNLMTVVLVLPNVAVSVGMALLSHSQGGVDASARRAVLQWNLLFTSVATAGGALVVGLAGGWLLTRYGRDFESALPALRILLGAAVIEGLGTVANQLVQSRRRVWLALGLINLPRDLAFPLLAWWFTPRYGVTGAAMAYAGGRSIGFVGTLLCAWLSAPRATAVAEPCR